MAEVKETKKKATPKKTEACSSFQEIHFNGLDDSVDLTEFLTRFGITSKYTYGTYNSVFGVLLSNHKQGTSRYMSYNNIDTILEAIGRKTTPTISNRSRRNHPRQLNNMSIHYCGDTVMDYLLFKGMANETDPYFKTKQFNINASSEFFDYKRIKALFVERYKHDVTNSSVYRSNPNVRWVFQYNENNKKFVDELISTIDTENPRRVGGHPHIILLKDNSLGKNKTITPEELVPAPIILTTLKKRINSRYGLYNGGVMGFAGGININNLFEIMDTAHQNLKKAAPKLNEWDYNHTYYIDIETGVRNAEDKFDVNLALKLRETFHSIQNYGVLPT